MEAESRELRDLIAECRRALKVTKVRKVRSGTRSAANNAMTVEEFDRLLEAANDRKEARIARIEQITERMRVLATRGQDFLGVRAALLEIVSAEEADRWLFTQLPLFEQARPVDLVKQGRKADVLQVIAATAEGVHV